MDQQDPYMYALDSAANSPARDVVEATTYDEIMWDIGTPPTVDVSHSAANTTAREERHAL